jgi:hypothetical protein
MSIEMTPDELVDLRFGGGVEILEFVHGLKLDNIESIRQHAVRFALQKMLALISGDMGHSGEDICTVCSTPFDAVAVVDATLSSFMIDVEVLQVVVEINGTCTEITT